MLSVIRDSCLIGTNVQRRRSDFFVGATFLWAQINAYYLAPIGSNYAKATSRMLTIDWQFTDIYPWTTLNRVVHAFILQNIFRRILSVLVGFMKRNCIKSIIASTKSCMSVRFFIMRRFILMRRIHFCNQKNSYVNLKTWPKCEIITNIHVFSCYYLATSYFGFIIRVSST